MPGKDRTRTLDQNKNCCPVLVLGAPAKHQPAPLPDVQRILESRICTPISPEGCRSQITPEEKNGAPPTPTIPGRMVREAGVLM